MKERHLLLCGEVPRRGGCHGDSLFLFLLKATVAVKTRQIVQRAYNFMHSKIAREVDRLHSNYLFNDVSFDQQASTAEGGGLAGNVKESS